jgi:hypothetical protein
MQPHGTRQKQHATKGNILLAKFNSADVSLAEPCTFCDACLSHLSAQPSFSESHSELFAKTPRHLPCLHAKRWRAFLLRTGGQSFNSNSLRLTRLSRRMADVEGESSTVLPRPQRARWRGLFARCIVGWRAGSPCRRRIELVGLPAAYSSERDALIARRNSKSASHAVREVTLFDADPIARDGPALNW